MGSMPCTARTRAVEAELADEDEVADVADGEAAIGAEDADGDGKVEAGALFLEVGGREVDGDAGGRKVEAAVLDGGADAVAAFADGGVGQADDAEGLLLLLTTPEKSTSTSIRCASIP